ncbi:MAG: DUF58 domain-containing protein [Clostridia bacterium]|nr:DUF58 domain-containing protein [Clostridia bacterium]
MIRRRVVYFFLLIGFTAFFIFWPGWISRLFVVLALALPLLSLLISLPFARSLTVGMLVPEKARRNTETELTAVILSRGQPCALPCFMRIVLRDLMDDTPTRYSVRSSSVAIAFTAAHSGVWQLDVAKAAVYDCLGLFSLRLKSPAPARVLVLPAAAPPAPTPDYTALSTPASRPKPGGGFAEIHELREYRPGDPMRSVHWKLTAKTDELIVREPQQTLNPRALIRIRLSPDRDADDLALDRLAAVSDELLRRDVAHRIFCENDGFCGTVASVSDFENCLAAILSAPPGTEFAAPPASDWCYVVPAARDRSEEAEK